MTAIDQLKEIYPPCADCGVEWIADSEREAQQLIEQNEWYKTTLKQSDPDKTRVRVHLGWQWRCPTCMFQHNAKDAQFEHERRKNLLLERTFHKGRMPMSAITENFTQSRTDIEANNQTAWDTVRAWDNDFSMWVQGQKGTGKTYLGHCILNRALSLVLSVYEVNSIDFCEWVYRQGERERRDAAHIDVLLLDDIDKAEWRVDSLIALWRLMDIRHRDKHVTIITSNVSPEVMRSRWKQVEGPERTVVDPMIDRMQRFKRITLEGRSFRTGDEP